MKKISYFLKKTLAWFAVLFLLLNLLVIISGKSYLYKGIANTYLKGRNTATIDEYAIFDTRVVKAGTTQEWNISRSYNQLKIPDQYLSNIQRMQTIAYLVIKDDSIMCEEYWNGYSDTSHTGSFSMAKSIISILVGIAIKEGKIKSVHQPLSDFLPEYTEGEKSKITIQHLLTMSSGIDFDESYNDPLGFAAEAYYGNDLRKLVFKYGMKTQPGKNFEYMSGNTQLLGFVLKKATGMTVSEYASQKLWIPIQAKQDAYWSLDNKEGNEKAYCCFNSNARDFARIGKLYLDSGKWGSKQIVPEEYVLQSIQPAPIADEGKPNQSYGYSWWLLPHYTPSSFSTKRAYNIFYARGILGQYIVVIPELKMIIVRLGKIREKESVKGHPLDLYWYIEAALTMYAHHGTSS
jgi:CubicO group peptidase (beta-lactamase class C family)